MPGAACRTAAEASWSRRGHGVALTARPSRDFAKGLELSAYRD